MHSPDFKEMDEFFARKDLLVATKDGIVPLGTLAPVGLAGWAKEPSRPFQTMSDKYPKYYKSVAALQEIDVYTVHHLFNIQDPSGCIQHASKKLLLSGVRTGGKSALEDIKEARDTLTRWLEINTPK